MVRLFWSQNAVLIRLAWEAWEPIFFIQLWSGPLKTLLPAPRLGTRYGIRRSSARFGSGIAVVSAQDSCVGLVLDDFLDLARGSTHCSSGLRSPRLGLALLASVRFGLLLGARLISALGSGSSSALENQLDARLGSARGLTRGSRLGIRLGFDSGLGSANLYRRLSSSWLGPSRPRKLLYNAHSKKKTRR